MRSDFLESPWANSHAAYETAVFNLRPAPEFATGEAILASTYRAAGFGSVPEGKVPSLGRELDRASKKERKRKQHDADRVSDETWRTVLHGTIESPKQPNQSSKRFLQLSPVVPDTALYSGSARLSSNSWNPGAMVRLMVEVGSSTRDAATSLWSDLQEGLSVGESDDVWAKWLQAEFEARTTADDRWHPTRLEFASRWPDSERLDVAFPARQFTRDLTAIVKAKLLVTRRQWVSMLEAVLRIGTVAHVLWLCDVNSRIWRQARTLLRGLPNGATAASATHLVGAQGAALTYGDPAMPAVRDLASQYLTSRLGINLLLIELDAVGAAQQSLHSLADIDEFLHKIASHRADLNARDIEGTLNVLEDAHARTIACKKGVGANIVEFCRHTLGQRQTANENLQGYDQGFQIRKRATYASAPWVVSLGPVTLISMVHCCLAEAAGPRSVTRFAEHLRNYGMLAHSDDFSKGELGRSLRMLGLVLDSPDAESGMLLIPPFEARLSTEPPPTLAAPEAQ